jgi:hypothetical protein
MRRTRTPAPTVEELRERIGGRAVTYLRYTSIGGNWWTLDCDLDGVLTVHIAGPDWELRPLFEELEGRLL